MSNADRARVILRVSVAGLLAAHGWYRALTGGYVGFGEYLTSQHIPLGDVAAIGITALEIVGSALLAGGRFVRVVTPLLGAVYLTGIVLLHRHEGWFVVGGGRNGMEYSVLLLVCLLVIHLQHAPSSPSPAQSARAPTM